MTDDDVKAVVEVLDNSRSRDLNIDTARTEARRAMDFRAKPQQTQTRTTPTATQEDAVNTQPAGVSTMDQQNHPWTEPAGHEYQPGDDYEPMHEDPLCAVCGGRTTAPQHLPADTFRPGPGMGEDGRCMTCDGRYCGASCAGRPGYLYVVGRGWVSPEVAESLDAQGLCVYWGEPFTPERFGL
jgi:hypothetical protein